MKLIYKFYSLLKGSKYKMAYSSINLLNSKMADDQTQ